MFKYGNTSERRMIGVNKLLCECTRRSLAKSKYDMTIPWMGGIRTDKEQNKLFLDGNTKADGFIKESYHQSGNAIDTIPVIDGYKNTRAFNYFAKLMFNTWQVMIYEGRAKGVLEWGGHFGKSGWDKPHWQIRL